MNQPANASGDQLVREYLARVTTAGLRYLPKGKRIAFVGQTRARIERECGRPGLSDPATVMDVLNGLGDPEELVRRERARLDAAWLKRRVDDPDAAAITVPLSPRPLTSRWRPATDPRLRLAAGARPAGPASSETSPGGAAAAAPAAGEPGAPADRPARAPVAPAGPRPPAPGTSPEGWLAPFRGRRPRWDAAGTWALARAAARTARGRPLEAVAVGLLGVGGFLFPFPFWLLGALAAVASRLFDVRDKWVAVAGAPALALLGSVAAAVVIGGHGDPVLVYLHALRLDVGVLLRAGAVLSGGYLAWRVRQGRRERLPPWKRR